MRRTVGDMMTKVVVSAQPDTPYKELVERMAAYRVSALPVLDEDAKLIGIVSEADLLLKEEYGADGGEPHWLESSARHVFRRKAAGATAADVMTSPVVTIGPDALISDAAIRIHRHGVKRLPVVNDEERVIGIVSRADLLKVFRREDAEIRDEIERDVLDGALWLSPGEITVDVRQGLVVLGGQVERRSLVPIVVRLVQGVAGVVAVDAEGLTHDFDDHDLRAPGPELFDIAPPSVRG